MKRFLPLATIEVFVWAILLLSTLIISKGIFAINIGTETFVGRVVTEALRVAVSGAIILVWLLVWKKITDRYFWRTVAK